MTIVKKQIDRSRDDAVRLTRTEKMSMISLAHAATVLDELQEELKNRIGMIDCGEDRLRMLSRETDRLLHDLRLTIPENQRLGLQHTAMDYECRIVPKLTPSTTNVVMCKEEFRELVDSARTRCGECTMDDHECEKCPLYNVLTSVLPLDDYHNTYLCPYNLGEWGN